MPIARNQILITIDGVKDLSEKGIAFRCRYELVGFTDDGKPRYQCIYLRAGERGESAGEREARAAVRERGIESVSAREVATTGLGVLAFKV